MSFLTVGRGFEPRLLIEYRLKECEDGDDAYGDVP